MKMKSDPPSPALSILSAQTAVEDEALDDYPESEKQWDYSQRSGKVFAQGMAHHESDRTDQA